MTDKQRLARQNEMLRNTLDDNDEKLEAVIDACDKALNDPRNQTKWTQQEMERRVAALGATTFSPNGDFSVAQPKTPCADCREHLEHGRWMHCQHAACVRALIGPCPAADWVESLEGR